MLLLLPGPVVVFDFTPAIEADTGGCHIRTRLAWLGEHLRGGATE